MHDTPGDGLIVGVGYLGRRVAPIWAPRMPVCFGTTRSLDRFAELNYLGLTPIQHDVLEGGDSLPSVGTVLYAVGLDRRQGLSAKEVYVDGLKRMLPRIPRPGLFIYISSTGVYGDHHGAWVDETTPPAPVDAGGEACWQAEQILGEWSVKEGWSTIILRLAGIYGPGRWIGVERLKKSEPILADPDGWLNLVHGDDGAHVVEAARMHGQGGKTYVVSDGEPILRRDFYQRLAKLAGTPEPTFNSSQAARHRGDRRINPARMREDLRPQWKFPNFESAWRAEHPDLRGNLGIE
ncbi:SDR family oxidoreductase [bacterium]|nr:SDR family oxidoreductase [bacterium]